MIDLGALKGQSRAGSRASNILFMRINAKTVSVLAAVSAIVLTGAAIAFYELYTSRASPSAALESSFIHIRDVLKYIGSTDVGRIGTVVAFVMIVEILFVGWRGSSLFRLTVVRSRSAVVDLLNMLLMFLNLFVFVQIALTFGASLLAAKFIAWVSSHYGWSRIALPSDGIFELAFSFAIYWLATSFVQYWGHRLMHTPMLWQVHRFHHAATELNMVTNFRQHPLEPFVLGFLSLVSPLIFLDVPPRVLLIVFFVATASDLLAHSQLPWGYGWIGRWLVQSPRVHQVHHSIDDEHQHLHFSNCPLWDHIFGTWYKGTNLPNKFGITDPAYEVRPLTQYVLDAWILYAAVVRWICSPLRRLLPTGTSTPPAGTASPPMSNGVATGS